MDVLILPDHPDVTDDRLSRLGAVLPGDRVVRHASGRPWLVGAWQDDQFALLTAGPRQAAVLGRTLIDRAAAVRALERADSAAGLDHWAARLPGSFTLTASLPGCTSARGSLSTAHHLCHARLGDLTVAATDPGRLAQLVGAGLDDDALALRLLSPIASWPLCLRPIWSGVRAVAVGHWLDLDPSGAARERPWWSAPGAEVPLVDAAPRIRAALVEGVAARAAVGPVGADLSGGLDSTSLCFIAAHVGAELTTRHWIPQDEANDDTAWARRAAAAMPAARHRFSSPDGELTWFQLSDSAGRPPAEGPLIWTGNRAFLEHQSRELAADGIALNLIGVGGDELFGLQPAYLWSLVRKHPVRSLPTVRRAQLVNRWDLRSTVGSLLDRQRFSDWLAASADQLAGTPRDQRLAARRARLGWGGPMQLPPWAAPDAADTACRLIREAAAEQPAPLHPDRLQHQTLRSVVHSGVALRQLNSALAAHPVRWDAPYLDDRVVAEVMSVRIEDRAARGGYKPVLAAALLGIVPDEILRRRSKGEFSADVHRGLRRNHRELLELCDDLRLADRGLVDAGALRRHLQAPTPDQRHFNALEATVAFEAWLRTATATVTTGGPR